MIRALITGITGQDGAYLAQLLLGKGYEVYGTHRTHSVAGFGRLQALGVDRGVRLIALDLSDWAAVQAVIRQVQPDEVYNLAGQSSVAASFEQPLLTADINAMGALRLLEGLRTIKADTRFFQASSGDMFRAAAAPQDESTPLHPHSAYGVAKAFAHWMTVNYRNTHGLFACAGILFNHESPLRGKEFVTRKITDGVARIKLGAQDRLTLGNLDTERDWGYAPEYVDAMWRMLQQETAEDYVLATGESHTVREFVAMAFRDAGIALRWEGAGTEERGIDPKTGGVMVEVSPELFRPTEPDRLIGNATKAKRRLGWTPRVSFADVVQTMVDADLKCVGPAVQYERGPRGAYRQ